MSTTAPATAAPAVLRFPYRFAGPTLAWANGGIVAGTLAERVAGGSPHDAAVSVRLERPVPVGVPLRLAAHTDGLALQDGGECLATAAPATLDLDAVPPPPTLGEAAATTPAIPHDRHPAPHCYVCGPRRPDGLGLEPGRVAGRDLAATVWHPAPALARPDGTLPAATVWAALDCPGWYGAAPGQPALLGTIVARQLGPVVAGRPLLVSAWSAGREGRKVFAGSALHTPGGTLVAAATAIWILIEEDDR